MTPSQTIERPSRRQPRSSSASQSVNGVTYKVAAVLVVLLALALLVAGARMLVAGVANYQAETFLSAWAKAGNEPQARAWQVAHAAAQRAIDLYPVADGDRLDRLGRIHSWQQFRQPYAAPSANDSRVAALQAYRAAVAARPSWPYTWARLAHSKLYLQEFDDEFAHALSQAFQLGPWRIAVNRELAEIGFSAWPHLNDSQRQATLESARRSVDYSQAEAQQLLAIAQHTGTVQHLCNGLSSELKTSRKLSQCPN